MPTEDHDKINLLSQRVDQLERAQRVANEATKDQIKANAKAIMDHAKAIHISEGRSRTIQWAVPGFLTFIMVVFGWVVIDRMGEMSADIKINNDNISAIRTQEAKTSTQLSDLKGDLMESRKRFEDITRLDGLTERALLLVDNLEDKSDDQDKSHNRDIRSLQSVTFDQEGRIRVLESKGDGLQIRNDIE